ncbi:MAG TPA: D-arabinono-1,4-lactone oxidase [Ktedonobacteraceae bacterium]
MKRRKAIAETYEPGMNWAGTYAYQAEKLHRPTTIEQVQEIVAGAASVHVLGSRHAFNSIADSSELLSLEGLPADIIVDHEAHTISFCGGITYSTLVKTFDEEGVALHTLASLPHISVAGAVATATHGSGVTCGNLATAVTGLEMVSSSGEIIKVARGDPDFDGLVVGLGALGAVTRITLEVQPAYEVRQRVFEGLSWQALYEHFDEIFSCGYSVSIFTRWGETNEQVWVKSRVDEPQQVDGELFGAMAATAQLHMIAGLDTAACTPQLGQPGLWSHRLPHFRPDYTPSNGAEIQSEYLVPRRHALTAIEALRDLADEIRPLLLVSELRRVAADRLWMSMSYEEDCLAIHFTWKREPESVREMVARLEDALAPCEARPHWGKVFHADAAALAPLYKRHADFVHLQHQCDPRGAFRNVWLKAHVLGNT